MSAIIIPTKNKADFVIRQLDYYVRVNSSHAVYVGDASDGEEAVKLRRHVEKVSKQIKAHYVRVPDEQDKWDPNRHVYIAKQVTEKYCCFSGDDDFQIPESLTRLERFLDENAEFSVALGQGFVLALDISDEVYGPIVSIGPYPFPSLEAREASARVESYFKSYFVPLFGLVKTTDYIENFARAIEMKDKPFAAEFLPSALAIAKGKCKAFDFVSVFRQTHEARLHVDSGRKWLTAQNWNQSYEIFLRQMGEIVADRDRLSQSEAARSVADSFQALIKQYERLSMKKPMTAKMWYHLARRKIIGQKRLTRNAVEHIRANHPETGPLFDFMSAKI